MIEVVEKTNSKNKFNESLIIFSVFIILIIFLVKVEDISKYGLFIYGIYGAFLISMGSIVVNAMKFNENKSSIFLGLTFSITGFMEIIYIMLELKYTDKLSTPNNISFVLANITDLFPLLSIYFIVRDNKRSKDSNLNLGIVTSTVLLCVLYCILTTDIIQTYVIKNIDEYTIIYVIDILTTLLMIFISKFIYKKISSCESIIDNYEKKLLKIIVMMLVLSRIPIFLHFIFKNTIFEYILAQIITNINLYYVYKYIVYSNVKKSYTKLNNINNKLIHKTMKLNNKNRRLIEETQKTQYLKEILEIEEQKLRSTLNMSLNYVIVFNENKEIEYVNKSFEENFDINNKYNTYEEALESKIIGYDKFLSQISQAASNDQESKIFINTIDNKVYQMISSPFEIKKNDKKVLCILIDKTDVKMFEKEVIQINEHYKNFLESFDDGIIVFEEDKKNYINSSCIKLLKGDIDILNIDINSKINKKQEMYVIDGKKVYVEISLSKYYEHGKNKTIVVIRDITSRKTDEIELKKNHESYKMFIDMIPDGICLLNRELSIKYVNKSFMKLLEAKSHDEIIRKNIKEVINLDSEKESIFYDHMKKVIQEDKYLLLLDYELISLNNKNIDVEINALPFSLKDGRYIMLIAKDLTSKKKFEVAEKELLEILKTDKVKTEFFANMSHELKTPLNVIFSSNQLLDSFYKGEKITDYNKNIKTHLDLVRQNSYRLQRLINNIIDLTKMESGLYKLNLSKYNIVTVIEDLFMMTEEYAKKKNISLIFDTELEDIEMYIDKYQIERIILNLLSNCIKFTENGGNIYLNIYYKKTEVFISVKDSGVGIPEDRLNLIFEEFGQVDKTLSRNTEGSGIGLSIVKNLIDLHEGSISVKSKEGMGTEFIIRLPIKQLDSELDIKDRGIYNVSETIKMEFSDIYY